MISWYVSDLFHLVRSSLGPFMLLQMYYLFKSLESLKKTWEKFKSLAVKHSSWQVRVMTLWLKKGVGGWRWGRGVPRLSQLTLCPSLQKHRRLWRGVRCNLKPFQRHFVERECQELTESARHEHRVTATSPLCTIKEVQEHSEFQLLILWSVMLKFTVKSTISHRVTIQPGLPRTFPVWKWEVACPGNPISASKGGDRDSYLLYPPHNAI